MTSTPGLQIPAAPEGANRTKLHPRLVSKIVDKAGGLSHLELKELPAHGRLAPLLGHLLVGDGLGISLHGEELDKAAF